MALVEGDEYLWYFVYLDCVECRGAIGSEQRNLFVVNDDGPDSYYHWSCYPEDLRKVMPLARGSVYSLGEQGEVS